MVPPLPSARERSHPEHMQCTQHLLHPQQPAQQTESTTDMEPEPAMISVPELQPVQTIVPKPEPSKTSEKLHEPATSSVPEGILGEYEAMEWIHVPSAKADVSAQNFAPLIILEEHKESLMPVLLPVACFVFIAQQRVTEVFDVPALPPTPTNSDA